MTVYSKLKETLYTLQGTAATLNIYAQQSGDPEIKNVFSDAASGINGVAEDLEKRVSRLEFEEPQYKGQ